MSNGTKKRKITRDSSFVSIRLKSHLSTFEPQLDELKSKYDGAMREKMVYKLEKEKLQNEINALKLGTSTPVQSKEIMREEESENCSSGL